MHAHAIVFNGNFKDIVRDPGATFNASLSASAHGFWMTRKLLWLRIAAIAMAVDFTVCPATLNIGNWETNHTAMDTTADFPETVKVGILVFDDFEPIDVWGFIEAFSISRFIGAGYGSAEPYPFNIVFISNETSGDAEPAPIRSYNGPRVAPDMYRDDALTAGIDLLMIPGGLGIRTLLDPDYPDSVTQLLDWVTLMDDQVSLMTTVCTGAAVLAATGLLNGKSATTNHLSFAWVTSFGLQVRWNNVSRWVDAGKYVTSAGVSAGTDMAFHLVSRLAGRAVAEQAAIAAEYDWRRDPEMPTYYPQQAVVPTSRSSD